MSKESRAIATGSHDGVVRVSRLFNYHLMRSKINLPPFFLLEIGIVVFPYIPRHTPSMFAIGDEILCCSIKEAICVDERSQRLNSLELVKLLLVVQVVHQRCDRWRD